MAEQNADFPTLTYLENLAIRLDVPVEKVRLIHAYGFRSGWESRKHSSIERSDIDATEGDSKIYCVEDN